MKQVGLMNFKTNLFRIDIGSRDKHKRREI